MNLQSTEANTTEVVEDNLEIENEFEADPPYSEDPENEEKSDSRFKDGDVLTFVRVRFPGNSKSFPFFVGKRRFSYAQKVVAMSDRGMTVGYINSIPYQVTFRKEMLPIRSISKIASEEDIQKQKDNFAREKSAENTCHRYIEKFNLDMILTHVEIIHFGKKAVFYFTAPARVDFRELVKCLVNDLKMRIELRQISVRDRAAALGSVGMCGLQTCCSSFLKNYGNVSIKMAKNQNLALIPSKLNGVCGQIKCCIKYEDEVYSDKRSHLPEEGDFIECRNGDRGKVLRLHILIEQYEMLTDQGAIRRYSVNQYHHEKSKLPEDYRFPESFENVVNETQTVIGLELAEQQKAQAFLEAEEKFNLPVEKEMEYAHKYSTRDIEQTVEVLKSELEEEVQAEIKKIDHSAGPTNHQDRSRPEQRDGERQQQNRHRHHRNNRQHGRDNRSQGNGQPNRPNNRQDNRTDNRSENRNNGQGGRNNRPHNNRNNKRS